ncbi:MAG: PQQ-binding-like beta-propeller repeat protein [Clostridiaceae bacterium]|jgi:outer membrane protein assembly factor BamB|nr:PQQ-binding-like beta-propeller repeat protein [Clostridiaceae bacterium]
MRQSQYVRYDNQFHRPRRKKPDYALRFMIGMTAVLTCAVLVLVLVTVLKQDPKETSPVVNSSSTTPVATDNNSTSGIVIASPTPTPESSRQPYQNEVLFPAKSKMDVAIGQPASDVSPSGRGVSQDVMRGDSKISSFERDPKIAFADPLDYQTVPGILTFRGNNYRNCASWGTLDSVPTTLEQVWEYRNIGSMPSSAWSFSWTGTGWTGQPLAVQWDYDIQQKMNMYPDKRIKQGMTEIIQAAMDGKIYFFDLEDGKPTRDPIKLGATIKGTPAIDPRGYPILYIGQGDSNGADGKIGFRIFSLIDGKLLHFQTGKDSRAHRTSWGACDSSPIVNGASDTLIFPSENGMIYTVKLNTFFDKASGMVSVSPDTVVYRYILNGITGGSIGVESSMSVYDHYGFFADNSGNLYCVDLNTFKMIWAKQLDDDSDVTPVIEEENGRVFLYIGTEVDWQKNEGDYMGASYTYKIDAMTGEEIWQTSQSCWTHNGATTGDDVNGGMLGTPIVGKKSISDLVIFSYCMTKGLYSGNRLVAYNKSTGEQVWSYEMNLYSWSSPVDCYDAEGNAYIVMCDSGGQIHLVNGQTGERITYLQTIRNKGTTNEVKTGLNMESSPIVIGDIIVIGSRSGSVFGVKIT